jgi:hypothetical protein
MIMLLKTGYEVSWNVASLGRIIFFETGQFVLACSDLGFRARMLQLLKGSGIKVDGLK